VRNVFLPIACHFMLLLALEALLKSRDLADAFVGFSWVVSQTLAAAVLLFTFRGGREHGSGRRALRTTAALAFAVAVWAVFGYLGDRGLVTGIGPLEAGLASVFLLAGVVPMLGGREQRQPREVWLSVAFLLSAIAHMNLAWSQQIYDSPFMWGYILLGFSLATPTVGAVFENVTLLESQTALSDHAKRLRHRMEILLNTLPVLVMSVDRERQVRYANRAAPWRNRPWFDLAGPGPRCPPPSGLLGNSHGPRGWTGNMGGADTGRGRRGQRALAQHPDATDS